MIDLAALLRLCDAATPGPWVQQPDGWTVRAVAPGDERGEFIASSWGRGKSPQQEVANSEFIAALDPATVRALIEMARRGRELLAYIDKWGVERCNEYPICTDEEEPLLREKWCRWCVAVTNLRESFEVTRD